MFRLWWAGQQGIDFVDKQKRGAGPETVSFKPKHEQGQMDESRVESCMEERSVRRQHFTEAKLYSSKEMRVKR